MSSELIVVAVVSVALVAAVGYWLVRLRRRHILRDQFGEEYEIVLEEHGSKRQAERELAARQERHDHLDIRPLDPVLHKRYAEQWRAVQARFVDEPSAAFEEADRLVEDVMADRGYPVGDLNQRMADLSVEHSSVLRHYRRAHQIAQASAAGHATTEDLREGMVQYRELFDALLEHQAAMPTNRH
jgi:hypothetical protein